MMQENSYEFQASQDYVVGVWLNFTLRQKPNQSIQANKNTQPKTLEERVLRRTMKECHNAAHVYFASSSNKDK